MGPGLLPPLTPPGDREAGKEEMKCCICLYCGSNPWLLSLPSPQLEAHRGGDPTAINRPETSPARCGGAAGVVNQAVANQRTATSQHQGRTPPQAALRAPAEPLHNSSPTRGYGQASAPQPQHEVCRPPKTRGAQGCCSSSTNSSIFKGKATPGRISFQQVNSASSFLL